MYIRKWEINNVIIASFVVILVIVGALVFLVLSAQNQFGTIKTQPGGAEEVFVSYDFSTIQETRSWETADVKLFWSNRSINGKQGIVILHPLSTTQPRYMEKKISLTQGNNYKLQVVGANIAGKAPFANTTGCDDSFIVLSAETEKDMKRQEFLVNSADGWSIFSMDISQFAGQETTVVVEGKAGGSCGSWAGEWSAIDKLEIIKL